MALSWVHHRMFCNMSMKANDHCLTSDTLEMERINESSRIKMNRNEGSTIDYKACFSILSYIFLLVNKELWCENQHTFGFFFFCLCSWSGLVHISFELTPVPPYSS